jgi:4'-phosphopantetheinyl transferase
MQPLTPQRLLKYTEQSRSCGPGCCDVWLLCAKVDVPKRELLETLLSADELARVGQFRFEGDRVRSIVARGGLRRVLSAYCGVPPDRLELQPGPYGKPTLIPFSEGLQFSVSHSGDYVLIGITSGAACGVDIERARPSVEQFAIAERFFSSREVQWLSGHENGFFRLWAAK